MKMIKLLFAMMVAFLATQSANAQSDKTQRTIGTKTQFIKVSGLCNMDKQRIEGAAYSVAGVKSAEWNASTQVLTLKYNAFQKNAAEMVQKNIALAGNDTEKYKADDVTYQNLPDCCHYQRHKS